MNAVLLEERDAVLDAELEVRRLAACYQLAEPADRRVVWAVLNKYAPLIEDIP